MTKTNAKKSQKLRVKTAVKSAGIPTHNSNASIVRVPCTSAKKTIWA